MDLESLYLDRCKGPHGRFKGSHDIHLHLPFLRYLVKDRQAKQVIELGVNTGASTCAFLLGLDETMGQLWSCDIKLPSPPIDVFITVDNWKFTLGDTRFAVDLAPDEADILLVDAAIYNRLTDLELYGPKVRPEGVILVHDLDRPEVAQACEVYAGNHDCGFQSIQTGHGMGIITC